MNKSQNNQPKDVEGLTLVIGGSGKTGRRVVNLLKSKGVPVRIGSRSANPSFDWNREDGWGSCLENVTSAYITYAPDLAMPGATDAIQAFVDLAKNRGVNRLVLLSGRGEEEAQACESIVRESGIRSTIVRASWFFQNFCEGAFVDMVRAGEIALPAGNTPEPFVDVDDISDVVVAALTEEGHDGKVYEVTGPRMLTFAEAAAELSEAIGKEIKYTEIPHDAFVAGAAEAGAPKDVIWMLDYLFSTVLDGRNAYVTDGVQQALGRPPRDFADYAQQVVARGLWKNADA
ncbi:MAG: NmrA family NAD(P)-binding protein [Acidobacteriota bacterium]|nr:NmrA family NAD(P)-binding protein [Acidobacteriota bacterium]